MFEVRNKLFCLKNKYLNFLNWCVPPNPLLTKVITRTITKSRTPRISRKYDFQTEPNLFHSENRNILFSLHKILHEIIRNVLERTYNIKGGKNNTHPWHINFLYTNVSKECIVNYVRLFPENILGIPSFFSQNLILPP